MLHDMDVSSIVKAIDDRIATLQQAKDLLSATAVPATEKRAQAAVAALKPAGAKTASASKTGRKPMSEEGRARIAAAQKKRWALKNAAATPAKKAAPAKAAKKATPAKAAKKGAPATAAKKSAPAKKVVAKKSVVAEAPAPAEETAS